jgi:hypothetical protein
MKALSVSNAAWERPGVVMEAGAADPGEKSKRKEKQMQILRSAQDDSPISEI